MPSRPSRKYDRVEVPFIAESAEHGCIFNGDRFAGVRSNVLIGMIGRSPENKPYLSVRLNQCTSFSYIASISNKNQLRALAHRILRAIGDE